MDERRARILVVDDERAMCDWLCADLPRRGYVVVAETSATAGLEVLESDDFDAVVTDLQMGRVSGIELCQKVAERRPDVPVLLLTAFGSLDAATQAIRAGAYDFITKPVDVDVLSLAIERAVRLRRLRDEVRRLRRAVAPDGSEGEIVGASRAMGRVRDMIARIAGSDATVLVTGESGTGKELAARALHARGARHGGPFVAVNCAAIPETLIESELFGHTRGAFTDAKAVRAGLFLEANGGTLFLDEIAELPVSVQPKLLRALQERKVRPVGGSSEVAFDARIIAATNRDLQQAVEDGRFRDDLYYRINVVELSLPPLRARGMDVLLLAHRFIEATAMRSGTCVRGVSPAAAEKLLAYPWPGNVRELSNCLEHAVALAQYDTVMPADLPERVREHRSSHVLVASEDPLELPLLEQVERRYVEHVLATAGGNKTLAASILGLDRKTLRRKVEQWSRQAQDKRAV